jgi:hypothetical protein
MVVKLGSIQKDIILHLENLGGRAFFYVGMTGTPGHRWCAKYDEDQVRNSLRRLEERGLVRGSWGWVEKT